MMKEITSPSNPLIKRLKALHEKKFRAREGLFLAEGLRINLEAVDAGWQPEMIVLAREQADQPSVQRLLAAAGDRTQVILTSPAILARLTRKDNPQAVLGAYQPRHTPLATLDRAAAPIWIVLEGIRDPGNLGTILRTADAIGAGGVILLDQGCDPYSVEAVRGSMGALFTLMVSQAPANAFFDWYEAIPAPQRGLLVGASLNTDTDYQAIRYPAPTFVFMGNEQSGLPAAYEQRCDALAKLPMRGKADSLNVAIACAVLCYEVFNQQRHQRA